MRALRYWYVGLDHQSLSAAVLGKSADWFIRVRLHGNEPRKGAKVGQRLREEGEEEPRRECRK